jgi:hypothetical protein
MSLGLLSRVSVPQSRLTLNEGSDWYVKQWKHYWQGRQTSWNPERVALGNEAVTPLGAVSRDRACVRVRVTALGLQQTHPISCQTEN